MPIPDSAAIDAAVVQRLASDPELLAACPNGVYFDEAPPEATAFVLVTLADAQDTLGFGGRAFEDVHYVVHAIELLTPGSARRARAAAWRIDQLLEDARLTIPGYGCLLVRRERRLRHVEPNDLDGSILWAYRGGLYEVLAAPDLGTP